MSTLIKILVLLVSGTLAYADEAAHPRVAELEQNLANQAHSYLSSRFPGMPFLVNVKVDPMFRNEKAPAAAQGEQLPYFDLSSEEIVDEWDDPARSLVQLQRRVRKTVVNVSVPNQLPESEALEIRESILAFLHLNTARDEVYINRRNWRTYSVQWMEVLLIATGIMMFLGGMLWINRASSSKIAKALEESARQSSSAPGAVAATAIADDKDGSGGRGGDLQMHDPVKLKDLAVRTIDSLVGTSGFPSHSDVFELNEVGRKNAAALGAILVEFPQAIQEKLFAYSTDDSWLNALNEPGVLDFESLMVLRKLLRNPHHEGELVWSALLLSVWRLSATERIQFLQQLPQEEAISILSALPKGLALSSARKLFPGGWARILDTSSTKAKVSPQRCEELAKSAQAIRGLRNVSMLVQYREELELLGHLQTSDPYEEREIYQVLPKDSRITATRPPFFKVFEVEDEVRRQVCAAFPVDVWAKALMDLRTSEKSKIESFFSEKQQYLYGEVQRKLNSDSEKLREEVGRIRQQIAHYLQNLASVTHLETKSEPEVEGDFSDESQKEAA